MFLDKADPAQRGDKKAPVTLFERCDRGRGDLALSDSEGTRRCAGATYEFEQAIAEKQTRLITTKTPLAAAVSALEAQK